MTTWKAETKSYLWSTQQNNALIMFHFLTSTKSEAETVKIGLSIDFKRINCFRLDGGMVEIDGMRG